LTRTYFAGRVALHRGDCLKVMRTLADNSIDACVTDPPYGIAFMGKKWDSADRAFAVEFWLEVFRALKPGAHLVAFGGTRSYHRLACAIEDAGFEIRDELAWVYGTGFPKSHDVSRAIDRELGRARDKIKIDARLARGRGCQAVMGKLSPFVKAARERGFHEAVSDEAVSDEAVSWQGFGTALKPAWEPICLARKPLSEKTVAANVLRWGTGAINVDACRVGVRGRPKVADPKRTSLAYGVIDAPGGKLLPDGRWPANLCHDGSAEVFDAFPISKSSRSEVRSKPGIVYGNGAGLPSHAGIYGFDDSGSAARFFYSAKASRADRCGSKHPTVKPVALMRWLCRLITPPAGAILDPFAGTGSSAEAAFRENFSAILIEREPEYCPAMARAMPPVRKAPVRGPAGRKGGGGGGRTIYGRFARDAPSARSGSSGSK